MHRSATRGLKGRDRRYTNPRAGSDDPVRINRGDAHGSARPQERMMTNNSSVVQNDVPAAGSDPFSQGVATTQQALDTILAAIPATPRKDQSPIDYVRKRQSVQPELIARALTAAGTAPVLQSFIDVAEARDNLGFTTAFRPVFDRMNGIAQDLKFAIDTRHAKSGFEALTVYHTAKRIVKGASGAAELAAHVANMKEVIRRGGEKKGTPPAAPAPPTHPPSDAPGAPTQP